MPQPVTHKKQLLTYFSLVMACALVMYLPLAYGYFSLRMKQVKAEMKLEASRTWKEDELTHLVFSPQQQLELKRPEEREILWEGKMYDIVTEHTDELGDLHVFALLDEKEMELKRWVRKFLTNDASESPTKKSKSDVLKVFSKALPSTDAPGVFFNEGLNSSCNAYTVCLYHRIDLPVRLGPPKLV